MIKTNFTRVQVLELMEYLDNRKDDEIFDTYQEELDYYVVEKQVNNINYTRCCTELKSKKAMNFEEWVESEGYTEKWDGYFKNGIKSTYWIVKGKYVMYTNEQNL